MTLWVTHVGEFAMRETFALKKNRIVTSWEYLSDLSKLRNLDDFKEAIWSQYPHAKTSAPPKKMAVKVWAGQLHRFVNEMKIGDLVVMPRKESRTYAIGKIIGPYKYLKDAHPTCRHTRKVKWITKNLPRELLDEDIYYSFKAFMSVYKVTRNNIANRIATLLEAEVDSVKSLKIPAKPKGSTRRRPTK